MNKEESKVKVGINYGKLFLKVSPKTMVDCNNDFKLHQFSPSGSAFKFSGAKRMLLQASETHLHRQEIVYLAKMTGIGSHACTHPCTYYISAPTPWDPDAPLYGLLCETV